MCTDTFLRLPEEKRNRILDAAWEEFSTVPFGAASVNQIIRRAGIPRGSFYQYFRDKSDLFSFLMGSARDRILQYRTILRETGGDLFAAAVAAYDRFLEQRRRGEDPLTDRALRVMEINSKMDMETFIRDDLLRGDLDQLFAGAFMEDVDRCLLRREDERFVGLVCRLTAVSVTGAVLDTLAHPEREAENRASLKDALEIIRRGSTEGGGTL